ncbi:phosphopantetheine adenylyltransferase [Longispora fulva]|uniref:Phosphopantetheine adenylyltransferase n=1 Tax=Longispora fulva TaxID=619741 RepID=A0A8J7KMZ6_9ACTN|nr:pantetheine-phosphate adenylyltransferase [Longispora fulva]MBG6141064.1 pantetheine-phosphate adenylyltransferase [Longispora fulva]GIG60666.1 phosphopantetheine adenylyltransferase [Longispora fulva]
MNRALCSGSFDPVTKGHLDIVERASRLFDEVIVAVAINDTKAGLFTLDERIELLRETTGQLPNVRVDSFRGLTVDYCKVNDVRAIVRGVRVAGDFDYELQMAQMNVGLAGVETLFMATNPLYSFIASSLVKEVAKWGGDVSAYVPDVVARRLADKFAQA